jgi:hypothetical protein
LDGKRIQNIEDIVWTWNSGMGTGNQSSGNTIVDFSDGKDVKGGQTLTSLTRLEKNTTYFWAIWAWDDTGKDVAFSSLAIPFIVEGLPVLPVKSIRQLEGKWILNSAINVQDGSNFTNDFPVHEFTGSIFCDDLNYDIYELTYSTKPNNASGTISGNNDSHEYMIEDVMFFELKLNCDSELVGKAKYNGTIYEISYSE